MKLKVQDYPDLVRDPNSKAILNVNQKALEDHLYKLKMNDRIEGVRQEVGMIKNDLEEIKKMLLQLASKG